jgi:nucleotide-binding universal stress UspA family protein
MDRSDADGSQGGGETTDPAVDGDLDAETPGVGEPIVESSVDAAAASVPLVVDATVEGRDRASRPDRVSSVLVAVGPGPHSAATVDFARSVAERADAWLELFHVVPSADALADGAPAVDEDAGADGPQTGDDYAALGEDLLSAAEDRLGSFDRADRWLVEDRSAAGAIVEQSPYYDLVVIGAPTTGTVGRFVFGSTTDTVIDEAAVPVAVVEGDGSTVLRAD